VLRCNNMFSSVRFLASNNSVKLCQTEGLAPIFKTPKFAAPCGRDTNHPGQCKNFK
jgi:hypothetical protein